VARIGGGDEGDDDQRQRSLRCPWLYESAPLSAMRVMMTSLQRPRGNQHGMGNREYGGDDAGKGPLAVQYKLVR